MITLYISSTTPYAGKSALCVGLARRLRKDGHAVGYMRPVTAVRTHISDCVVDAEAESMREAMGLTDPVSAIWPVCLDPLTVEAILRGEGEDSAQLIKDAFAQVSTGKDIVLLEGGSRCIQGLAAGLSCDEVTDLLEAKVLLVAKYDAPAVIVVDDLLAAKQVLGSKMIGVVLNAVPRHHLDLVEHLVVPFLRERDILVYAVLPLESIYRSVSVGELAEALQGDIICRPDLSETLVENLAVGAMSVDSALTYFRRKLNLGVITGGDRADIQLAALETSTKCLILTGNLHPSPLILNRAEELGVSVILVKHDTMTTVQLAEEVFGKTRFQHEKKIGRFECMLTERFDFARLYGVLGLGHQKAA